MILADYPIAIPHRTPQFTKAALKYAADLLDGWDLRVRVIQVHVVPYGVPLDAPAMNPKSLQQRLRKFARDIALRVSAEVVFARNWEQGFRRVLSPRSTVLLAGPSSRRSTSEKRLAARLRKFGHAVIWVNCD
jgi:hypothetical protein